MRPKILITVFFIFAVFATLTAFVIRPLFQPPVYSGPPLVIGWIGPLTGPVSFLGIENHRAIQLAVTEYNTRKKSSHPPLVLQALDDQYLAENSLEAYRKLVTAGAKIIFLSTYDGTAAVAPFLEKDRVILINPIDNDSRLSRLSPNLFLIAKRTSDLASTIVDDILSSGLSSAFILNFAGDEFMPSLAQNVKKILEAAGGQVLSQSYSAPSADFSSLLAPSLKFRPQAYVFLGYQEIGPALSEARRSDPQALFYAVNLGMKDAAGPAINSVRFTDLTPADSPSNRADAFIRLYQKRYAAVPVHTWTAMQAYDAAQIVISQLPTAVSGPDGLTANLRTGLLRLTGFPGISGDISIQPDGTSRGILWHLYQYSSSQITRL